jgi:hypothetical protein
MNEAGEAAWDAIHEALRRAGPSARSPSILASSDPTATPCVQRDGPRTSSRGKAPQTVSGTGDDEVAALRDLDDRLRGVPKPDGSRMDELRRRLRLAYVRGAEDRTVQNVGRGLTQDELGRVIGGTRR